MINESPQNYLDLIRDFFATYKIKYVFWSNMKSESEKVGRLPVFYYNRNRIMLLFLFEHHYNWGHHLLAFGGVKRGKI